MDFNDIASRLERIYSSIQARADDNIGRHINAKHSVTNKAFVFDVSFDKEKEADKLNRVMIIVHNLANLKDHLKNWIRINGGDEDIVKNEINLDKYLQTVIDLANAEKHGYPTNSNRSKLNPKIVNVESVLQITADSECNSSSFTFGLDGTFVSHGKNTVVIIADIVDGNNNKICSLDELIENSIRKWEEIIKKINYKVPIK